MFYALLLLLAGALTACLPEVQVEAQFAREHACAPNMVRSTSLMHGFRYSVEGCGKIATYIQRDGRWDEMDVGPSDAPRSAVEYASVTPASRVRRQQQADGATVLSADVHPLRGGFRVIAGASPERAKDHLLFKFYLSKQRLAAVPSGCDVKLLVDLERAELGTPTYTEDEEKHSWQVKIPLEMGVNLTKADRAVWQVCGETWQMSREERDRLAELVAEVREAIAWESAPRDIGATTGKLRFGKPPSGGWPGWSRPLPAVPASVGTTALDASALYERVKSSVYRIQVQAGSSDSVGSAVAITRRQLLTNCHVVQGADRIAVESDIFLTATVVKADLATDRCVLEVSNGELVPIAGVRKNAELKVGERVFTIGAPEGFDRTLGEGLVSGLRTSKGLRYVQISAPISKGSSGGGLFDQYGNLIGITTLIWVGETQTAQSLNFALAADEFLAD